MRTKNKDILMICKLWYVKTDSVECCPFYEQVSALKSYIEEYTMCPQISNQSLLHHLTRAVKEFVSKDKLLSIFESSANIYNKHEELIVFLINTYVNLLLDVDCDGIDLKDYIKIQRYVIDSRRKQNKEDIYLPWWELDELKEKK